MRSIEYDAVLWYIIYQRELFNISQPQTHLRIQTQIQAATKMSNMIQLVLRFLIQAIM